MLQTLSLGDPRRKWETEWVKIKHEGSAWPE